MGDAIEKRKVVLGITGSIAAYKAAELARLLLTRGFKVRVIMTESAQEFISPLTMEVLTGENVCTDFWDSAAPGKIDHLDLANWADVVVVAPASADTISGMVAGRADNVLLATIMATRAQILVAPAMNTHMYTSVAVQYNLTQLENRGVHIIPPVEGVLACGTKGVGRLPEPWELFHEIRRASTEPDLSGKRILISTGPTWEAIDPVRVLSNRSSGKMGVALAREAFRRGADVTLVHGPVRVRVPRPVTCYGITTAKELHDQVMCLTYDQEERPDVVIMAAAVADYRPADPCEFKIKKTDEDVTLALTRNPDVLLELGKRRGEDVRPLLVGFAVETGELDELLEEARQKLIKKNADLIVGNFAAEALSYDTNRVWLVERSGKQAEVALSYKSRVANKILDRVVSLL